MKLHQIICSILTILTLLLMVACGAAAPASNPAGETSSEQAGAAVSDAPVYPGATPLQKGENALVDTMAGSFQSQYGQAEINIYTLPQDATADSIKSFYDGELSKAGWTSDANMTAASGPASTFGWTREKEVFVVSSVSDPTQGTNYLMVVQGSTQ